ncbi:MAG: phosphonate ABC transporter, permease protein PhnE [Acuticoccus sp.]
MKGARGWSGFGAGLALAAAVLWSLATADMELSRLVSAGPRIAEFLGRMVPPDPTVLPRSSTVLPRRCASPFLGTLGAVILSVPLGLAASETMAPPVVYRAVRTLLAFIRAIPLLLVAMLMVGRGGARPAAGIIAIAIHAAGMLYISSASSMPKPSTASPARRSTRWRAPERVRCPATPCDLAADGPVVARDTIFRFELNLRESLILGIVGAGGIGFYIQTYVRSFQYEKAASVTIAIVLVVIVIEGINVALRRRFS